MLYRMRQKRGTAAEWAAANPVLLDGEIGFEKDTKIIKLGDGVLPWVDLTPALDGLYLPVTGRAADASKLNGLNPSQYLLTTGVAADSLKLNGLDASQYVTPAAVSQTSATRKLVSHWGSGTAFPTTGVLAGDTFIRSDLGTNGSVWVFTNGAAGFLGWVNRGPIVCTSTTRPANSSSYAGMEIFETDTGRSYQFLPAGTQIAGIGIGVPLWDQVAGPPEIYTPTYSTGFADFVSGSWQPLRLFKMGRRCWAEGLIQQSGTSPQTTMTAGTNYTFGTVPTNMTPLAITKAVLSLWAPNNNLGYILVNPDKTLQISPLTACATGWNFGGTD
jgi:hypothetical protein